MNIGELFSHFIPNGQAAKPNPVAAPAAAPAATTTTPGNIPASAQAAGATVTTAATAPNGVIPANATPVDPAESKLDAFKDIWNTAATDTSQGQPLFNVNKEQLLELARKQDFKPQMSQEQIAAIAAGGQEAVTAMAEIMNDMTQRAYAQSAHASTQLIEAARTKMEASQQKLIDSLINKRAVQSSLQEANPLLRNPAVAPLIEMATANLTAKHPTASPQEISAMATSYITSLAEAFQAPQTKVTADAAAATAANKEEDWSKFFQQ